MHVWCAKHIKTIFTTVYLYHVLYQICLPKVTMKQTQHETTDILQIKWWLETTYNISENRFLMNSLNFTCLFTFQILVTLNYLTTSSFLQWLFLHEISNQGCFFFIHTGIYNNSCLYSPWHLTPALTLTLWNRKCNITVANFTSEHG